MERNISDLVQSLTLEEKASLCSGKDFWNTQNIDRLNIPSITMNDGPHGLRKQGEKDDNLGIGESIPSTCFPTYSALGSSWDTELINKVGSAIAEECLQEKVSIILGPGVNIKRSPLCGRNFEYLSEDPYLAGKMAASYINGVQQKGVGTSLKHYAVNSQEYMRIIIDSVVDDRALREIYLSAFEMAVKESKPWTVMAAYNKYKGIYCSESHELLSHILRDEWNFDGIVVTDWGACNNRVNGLVAGQDLEMPSSMGYNNKQIVMAVQNAKLDEKVLDETVARLLKIVQKSIDNLLDDYKFDIEEHHKLAIRASQESIVLLKNEDNILPINKKQKVALIGEFAKDPHFQGGGSSKINPIRLSTAFDAFYSHDVEFTYSKGYDINSKLTDKALLSEAIGNAKTSDIVIVMAGLTNAYESEGYDKDMLDLPPNHNELIEKVAEANPNTIVVLQNGSPLIMPWIDNVKGILECYLAGQGSGEAIYNIITGKVNPSGKLAETFPLSLSDNPSFSWFGGGPNTVEYRESIYVGYRYYDTAKKDVLFPFGYGLSYTNFEYSNLELSSDSIFDTDTLNVKVTITNTGDVAGAEVAQLYVKDIQSTIFRPEKELKCFSKVYLEAGEEKIVEFKLDKRSFAYYNVNINDWHVETGEFNILVCASSVDIRLSSNIKVTSTREDVTVPDYKETIPCYYDLDQKQLEVTDPEFKAILGRAIPKNNIPIKKPFGLNSPFGTIRTVFIGKIIYKVVSNIVGKLQLEEMEHADTSNLMQIVDEMPIRSLASFSNGMVNMEQLNSIVDIINGKLFRGAHSFIKNSN